MSAIRGARAAIIVALAVLIGAPPPACAEAPDGLPDPTAAAVTPVELSGTLAKVRASGRIALGYRESSVPFSWVAAPAHEPIGYSIELCRALVTAIAAAVARPLFIAWVPVTPESRIDAVASGRVDLECGSTTNNVERQKQVAFSPTMFVSGTKLLVKEGSPIRSFRDLAGKRVVVTRGTTNEKALRDLSQKFGLGIDLVVMPDHGESFARLVAGSVDAFATDDVLLYGIVANDAGRHGRFEVVGEFLSYDPYGIMFRKDDPALATLVVDTFHDLAGDGEIDRQYTRWFMRKLPSGVAINLPMSEQLRAIIATLSVRRE